MELLAFQFAISCCHRFNPRRTSSWKSILSTLLSSREAPKFRFSQFPIALLWWAGRTCPNLQWSSVETTLSLFPSPSPLLHLFTLCLCLLVMPLLVCSGVSRVPRWEIRLHKTLLRASWRWILVLNQAGFGCWFSCLTPVASSSSSIKLKALK